MIAALYAYGHKGGMSMKGNPRMKRKKRPVFFLIWLGIVVAGVLVIVLYKKSQPVFQYIPQFTYTPVLDAGHGGEDMGTTSASGLLESHINLEITKRTELLMRFFGVEPVMTRTEDVSLHDPGTEEKNKRKQSDFDNRLRIVGRTKNPFLISIHQNYYEDPAVSGGQAFYGKAKNSRPLADTIQSLLLIIDPNNRRTVAPISELLYLFKKNTAPAVLVECGFLSCPEEAARLASGTYQQKIAAVITAAFLTWEKTV